MHNPSYCMLTKILFWTKVCISRFLLMKLFGNIKLKIDCFHPKL